MDAVVEAEAEADGVAETEVEAGAGAAGCEAAGAGWTLAAEAVDVVVGAEEAAGADCVVEE